MRSLPPSLDYEDKLKLQGYELVAGIDEAGRGALAGPVVAGAIILPRSHFPWFELVRDSKELTARERESLFPLISQEAIAVGVGAISHHTAIAVTTGFVSLTSGARNMTTSRWTGIRSRHSARSPFGRNHTSMRVAAKS